MALTAVITLNPAGPIPIATEIQALVTVSNSGGSPLSISNLVPHMWSTPEPTVQAPFRQTHGKVYLPAPLSVPAGGSAQITFPVVFQSGTGLTTNSVGCLLYGSDGSVFEATPATISIVGNNQYA